MARGCDFLYKNREHTLTYENLPDDLDMVRQVAQSFVESNIDKNLGDMESLTPGFMKNALKEAGDLGLLGAAVPEDLGGSDMGFVASMIVADAVGPGGSFATAFGAQTGIAMLPILLYGTDAQKEKYIPGLATGDLAGSYCLTEPGAGSDANSGKTKAELSADQRQYILNGQKMWITNGGFADVYIVFAKIDDDKKLSCFVVDKDSPGLSVGEEEKKLGIKGSSTVQVYLEDCKISVESMLGKRQEGFKIALNILNAGRIKLASSANGAAKSTLEHSLRYAGERKQFGGALSSFQAIQHKIAEMAQRTFSSDTATLACGDDIEKLEKSLISSGGNGVYRSKRIALEEYAVECALLKVIASESLDHVIDEGLQIYGGMGYSAEAPMERAYRDARITRIYEGTNEINRMAGAGMAIQNVQKNLGKTLLTIFKETVMSVISLPKRIVTESVGTSNISGVRALTLLLTTVCMFLYRKNIRTQQAVLMSLADMMSELLMLTCTHSRVSNSGKDKSYMSHILSLQAFQANQNVKISANDIISSLPSPVLKAPLRLLALICLAGPRVSRFKVMDKLGEKLVNESA